MNVFFMKVFDSLNLVTTFDESLWMKSETASENPPKVSKMNGRYTKPS